jgi:hypothetical protein
MQSNTLRSTGLDRLVRAPEMMDCPIVDDADDRQLRGDTASGTSSPSHTKRDPGGQEDIGHPKALRHLPSGTQPEKP